MTTRSSLRIALAALALASSIAAQSISVSSTNPNSAAQGTINLNVVISGKGFKNGARAQFFVSGTTNPGGVTVNSTAFNGSTQLTANISVDSTATVSGFDAAVTNPDGNSGKGSDVFSVVLSGNNAAVKCTPGPLPAGISLVATFNSTTGTPVYQNLLGKTVRGRLITILGRQVIMAAAGGNNNLVDVFFLDPVTGAVLDGTWAQLHLQMSTPEPSFYAMILADVNGDGILDLILGARNFGVAWVYLGQFNPDGTFGFGPYHLLTPSAPNSGFGAALGVGSLDGSTSTIALGITPGTSKRPVVPGIVALFKYNSVSGGFDNYATLIDPQNSSTSAYGDSVAIGDVTGDSMGDLIVGASGNSRAWIYPGSGSGLSTPFYVTSGSDGLGGVVAVTNMAGVSGAYADLFAVNGSSTNPRAFVYSGPVSTGATPLFTLQPVQIDWPQSGLDFADINGDGFDDVVFGAESTGCSGSAFIYRSGTTGYQSTVIQGPLSNYTSVGYGSAASAVPGTHIILVGDKWWTGPSGIQSGQVYVYTIN